MFDFIRVLAATSFWTRITARSRDPVPSTI